MQREEFLQQLWLDYIHLHPDLGSLDFWPSVESAEYLVVVTLNHGPFSAEALMPTLRHFGYRCAGQFAMADRGMLITLLSPATAGPWLVLGELQPGTLTREPRRQLEALVSQTPRCDTRGQNLLCRGRPWPMPEWASYQQLRRAHPLAAWLAALGPRLHHAGFDCDSLGHSFDSLDQRLQQAGLIGSSDRQSGVFPIAPLLNYRFYPACSRRLAFADGDEQRIALGGIAMVQKCLSNSHERAVELLLPEHTRCEIA